MISDGLLTIDFIVSTLNNIYSLMFSHWALSVIVYVVLLYYVIQLIRGIQNKD